MRWMVLLMICALGLIIKRYTWSNILTKQQYKRNHRKIHGCDCEYDGHDWNGHNWFDGYNWHE